MRRNDDGVAAVELALVLPVFLALVLASIDFALAFRQQIMLRNAASNAASYAAVQPCDLGNPASGITYQALADLQHVNVLKPSNVVVSTSFTDSNGAPATGISACQTAAQVQVTVTAPYNLITGDLLGAFGVPQTLTVSGHETVQIEGKSA
jgi:Flp pilus assembly protein TadG